MPHTRIQSTEEAAQIGPSDFWIVTLGDSFSSGEGNPNNIGWPINAWKWLDDEKCHRSKHAWPYLVAEYYHESRDFPNAVKHSFMACSGASIERGLLNPYRAGWPLLPNSPTQSPQLQQLQEQILKAGREPDVVLLSAGGNDVGFSDVVIDCLLGQCPGGRVSSEVVRDHIDALSGSSGLYAQVAEGLNSMGISANDVYLLIYPSPLKGKKRRISGEWGPEKVLSACWKWSGKKAWKWAQNHVVEPLQQAQHQAVDRHGWNAIDGHIDEFKKHTYCPRAGLPGADSWWVGVTVSLTFRQYGIGAFHPNKRGHKEIAEVTRNDIQNDVPVGWQLHEPDPGLPDEAREWIGNYSGQNDGRRARLTIRLDSGADWLNITLEDLERNITLTGFGYVESSSGAGAPVHILKDLTLTNGGCTTWSPPNRRCVKKKIKRLFLHTWDDNHVSGYTSWHGRNYGLAFSKQGVVSNRGEGGRFTPSDWVSTWSGTYVGYQDGRNARLVIAPSQNDLLITLDDIDRSVTFEGAFDITTQTLSSPNHVLTNLRLTSADGRVKQIDRLFLHTWDTNYISGYSTWRGTNFGSYFVRK